MVGSTISKEDSRTAAAFTEQGNGSAVGAGAHADDVQAIRAAVVEEPGSHRNWHNLGVALMRAGNRQEAFEAFRRALAIDRAQPTTLRLLAELLSADGQSERALPLLTAANLLAPADAAIASQLARVLVDAGDGAQAIQLLRGTISQLLEPAPLMLELGGLLEDIGDAPAASAVYRQALALAPRFAVAMARLLVLETDEQKLDEMIGAAEALLADPTSTNVSLASIGYGLAKALDRRNLPARAFAAARRANTARRKASGPLDRAELAARVDAQIAVFTPMFFDQWRGAGNASTLPVFVVGLPRSGTTLTERIIASHPEAAGAGERTEVARCANTLSALVDGNKPWPLSVAGLDGAAILEVAATILTPLERLGTPGIKRVVDKQPLNVFYLGLLSVVLPNCRIILCRRDPRDTLTSIFFEDFAESESYATDLGDLAFFNGQVERLVNHWRDTLPTPIHIVEYERLVARPEEEARALMDDLLLPWDDRCLKFFEQPAIVRTPSRWQVRSPISTASVGRWKRYGDAVTPLLNGLAANDWRPAA